MKQQTENRLSRRNLWCFSLGTLGRDAANTMFGSYLLTYILFTRTLDAKQFAAINMFMVAARIFDGFNDPVMGAIVDITRTKYGKFKPWILIGMLTSGMIIFAAFSSSFQGWSFVFFVGILYLLYSVFFTMNDISYWGMIPSLARHTDDRNLLTSRTTLLAGAGSALVLALLPTFTAGSMVIGGNAVTAYRVLAGLFVLLFIGFQCFTLFGVKEQPLPPKKAREKFSFKHIIKVIAKNDQLIWAAFILFFYFMASGLNPLQTTYIYFSFGYNGTLVLLFSAISSAAAAFAMLFFAPLSKKFTRRQLMLASVVVSVLGYLSVLFIGTFFQGDSMLRFILMAVCMMFAFLGPQIMYLIAMLCISNSIEYNEWKTGSRDEGIVAAVRPFTTKVSLALAQFMITVIYLVLGVTNHTNQISAFENQASKGLIDEIAKTDGISQIISAIPEGTTKALLACMTLLPAAFVLISYLIFRFKYKITEEKYDGILQDLEERRAEQQDGDRGLEHDN